jgi:tetratricopeptide (TPR) repeat protein
MKALWMGLLLTGLFASGLMAQPTDAPGWFAQGNQLYMAKDYDGALAAYSQGLRLDNRSAPAYEGVGNCFASKGDVAHALQYYGFSLQLNPNNPALRDYVSRLQAATRPAPSLAGANQLYRQGAYDQAVAAYQALILAQPNDPKAYQGLGNAYYAKGDQQDAMVQYHKSLALNPGNTALADFVASHERVAAAAQGGPGDWPQPLWRSAILPGWGQFYNGQSTKGLVLGGLTVGCLVGVVSTYMVGEQAMNQYHAATGTNESAYNTPFQTWATMADWNHAFYIGFGVLYTYTLIDAIVGARPSSAVTALMQPDAPLQVMADAKGFGFKARLLSF